MRPAVPLLGLLLAALVGCGTSDDSEQARGVVDRFYTAIREDRGEEACAQLSATTVEELESQSERSCSREVLELDYEGGPIVAVAVYATNAKVDLGGGESAFLNREPTGWKINAVACRAEQGKPRDRPYDCEAEA